MEYLWGVAMIFAIIWKTGSCLECFQCVSTRLLEKGSVNHVYRKDMQFQPNAACEGASLFSMFWDSRDLDVVQCGPGERCGVIEGSVDIEVPLIGAITLEATVRACMPTKDPDMGCANAKHAKIHERDATRNHTGQVSKNLTTRNGTYFNYTQNRIILNVTEDSHLDILNLTSNVHDLILHHLTTRGRRNSSSKDNAVPDMGVHNITEDSVTKHDILELNQTVRDTAQANLTTYTATPLNRTEHNLTVLRYESHNPPLLTDDVMQLEDPVLATLFSEESAAVDDEVLASLFAEQGSSFDGKVCYCNVDLCSAGSCPGGLFKIGPYCVEWYILFPLVLIVLGDLLLIVWWILICRARHQEGWNTFNPFRWV